MKFTKEQCLEPIKALLGQTKLTSDRTILESLDNLIPLVASDETELKDFIEKVSPTFKSMESNIKHEQSVFAKDFKEKNAPKPVDAKPNTTPEPTKSIPSDEPAYVKEMREYLSSLKKEVSDIKNERNASIMFKEAKSKFDSFNPNPSKSALIELAFKYAQQNIGKDASADSLAMSAKSHYDELLLASGGTDGYVPTKSAVETGNAQMWDAMKKQLRESGHLPDNNTN